MAKKKEEKKVVEEEKPQEEKKVVKKEEPQKKKVVKKEEPQEEKESVLKIVAENGLDTGLVAGALNSEQRIYKIGKYKKNWSKVTPENDLIDFYVG